MHGAFSKQPLREGALYVGRATVPACSTMTSAMFGMATDRDATQRAGLRY
jgi:hypothetical protein